MPKLIETLLLLGLPGSGKGAICRYLQSLPQHIHAELHIGPQVVLADLPYLRFMRRVDEVLTNIGGRSIFFRDLGQPFIDSRDWAALVKLLNEDYEDLKTRRMTQPASASGWLLNRLDAARTRVGLPAVCANLAPDLRRRICDNLEREARSVLVGKHNAYPTAVNGNTIIIELACAFAVDEDACISSPGYAYSLSRLNPAILEKAGILLVSHPLQRPDQQANRTGPAPQQAWTVAAKRAMDEVANLVSYSDRPSYARLQAHGRTYYLPLASLDNTKNITSFVAGGAASSWPAAASAELHKALMGACDRLVAS